MNQIAITALAEHDIESHFLYLAERNPTAAIGFTEALEKEFEYLSQHPGIGHAYSYEHPRLKNMRSHTVRGYRNYLIFYVRTAKGIKIARVLHGARDINNIFNR